MTVSTTLNKIIYLANGAQVLFTFPFPVISAANLQVFVTDASGNVVLQAPSAYTVLLNPATGTNPTQAGGSVTFGVAPANGFTVTLFRNLALTQLTSLANQGTLYQPVEEAALDYEMMVSQGILEVQSRALVVSVSDPTPSALPAVAARANLGAGYDSLGNPIAISLAPAGTISSAMAPVVGAASLSAGRTAFGLGNIATGNVGAGLQNVSGSIRVVYPLNLDSTPITIGVGNHLDRHYLTANVTYTLPLASTLFNGFGFWVTTESFVATLAINAADVFNGMSTGVSLIVGPGQTVFIQTNAGGTWFVDYGNPISLNSALNLQINASVAASALTIALKDRNGNDPSATSPIIVGVRDADSTKGDPAALAVGVPLSLTVPSGATLGTVNGQANRIWLGLFNNAGTPVLGVYNSLSGSNILAWDETTPTTGTAISAGSTLAQTWYTASGVTTKPFRILGYIESTQPTAGAWTVAPSKLQLFGPGVKRPGDTVQEASATSTTAGTTTSATYVALTTGQTIVITPQSAADLIRVETMGTLSNSASAISNNIRLSRGVVAATNLFGNVVGDSITIGNTASAVAVGYDIPNTIAATTYAVQGLTSAGTLSYGGAPLTTIMSAKEIFI